MIFVDTNYFVSLLMRNDKHNKRSNELIEYIDSEKSVINNTVLTETINFLSKCSKFKQGNIIRNNIDIIMNTSDVYYLTNHDYLKSIDLFEYYNGSINFSDCTILQTMEILNIDSIVSFDKDFDKIKGIKRIH